MGETVIVHGRPCVRGIDVSRWQGSIDWWAVARARAFGVIKASGGDGGLYTDGLYRQNLARVTATGMPSAAYHFLGAHIDGRQQAARFVAATDGYSAHALPPVVDVEHAGTPAKIVADFVDELDRQVGRRWQGPAGPIAALIYTGLPMQAILQPGWVQYDLWLAAYLSPTYPVPGPDVTALGRPRVPRPWAAWSVWQWAGEDGRCPGVAGACDQNVATVEWFTRTLGPLGPDLIPNPTEELTMADITVLQADIAAVREEVGHVPATIGNWMQDTRRYEGQAPLGMLDDDGNYWQCITRQPVDGHPMIEHLTPESKAVYQLDGTVQTVVFPTGAIGDDGKPETIDFLRIEPGSPADNHLRRCRMRGWVVNDDETAT